VIGTLSTADADVGDVHSYTVSDSRFEVAEQNGQMVLKLKDTESLDFETAESLNLTITTTDSQGLSFSEGFTIDVQDVAEQIKLEDGGVSYSERGIAEHSVTGGSGNDSITGGDTRDILHGGAGDDQMSGLAGNDVLHGDAGNDSLDGNTGRDLFVGGAGDDHIDGGTGLDLAQYSGNRDDYTITQANGTFTIGDNRDGSPDGTDSVVYVEKFRFADGDVEHTDSVHWANLQEVEELEDTSDDWTQNVADDSPSSHVEEELMSSDCALDHIDLSNESNDNLDSIGHTNW
jgi:Ca2+-binding RTX toxin-like protein